jgi:hemin uptake protein HemP
MGASGEEESGDEHETNQISTGMVRTLTITNDRVDSRDLFAGTRELTIVHGPSAYRLRLTAQNKLILTK